MLSYFSFCQADHATPTKLILQYVGRVKGAVSEGKRGEGVLVPAGRAAQHVDLLFGSLNNSVLSDQCQVAQAADQVSCRLATEGEGIRSVRLLFGPTRPALFSTRPLQPFPPQRWFSPHTSPTRSCSDRGLGLSKELTAFQQNGEEGGSWLSPARRPCIPCPPMPSRQHPACA